MRSGAAASLQCGECLGVIHLDGTLATGGRADAAALAAIERLRRTGRRVILVTLRRLGELTSVLSSLEPFDCVVAENGALLYWPSRREITSLCHPVPESFVRVMLQRGVTSLVRGQAVVQSPVPGHASSEGHPGAGCETCLAY